MTFSCFRCYDLVVYSGYCCHVASDGAVMAAKMALLDYCSLACYSLCGSVTIDDFYYGLICGTAVWLQD